MQNISKAICDTEKTKYNYNGELFYDFIHFDVIKGNHVIIGLLEKEYDYDVELIATTNGDDVEFLSDIFFSTGLLNSCRIGRETKVTMRSHQEVLYHIKNRRINKEITVYDIVKDFLVTKNTTRFFGEKHILNVLPRYDGQFIPTMIKMNRINGNGLRSKLPYNMFDKSYRITQELQEKIDDVLIGGNHLGCILGSVGLTETGLDYNDVLEDYGIEVQDIYVAWNAIMNLSKEINL